MQTVNFTNEKGNPSNTVRTALKEALVKELKEALGNRLVDTPRGLAIELATDFRTQDTIYALISPVITLDIEAREPKPSKAKETEVIELNLLND